MEIKFIPAKIENGWEIQQITPFGRFKTEEECKMACDALYKKYNSISWDEDQNFVNKIKDIPTDLFYKETNGLKNRYVIKKFFESQQPIETKNKGINPKELTKEIDKFIKDHRKYNINDGTDQLRGSEPSNASGDFDD